jgi:hypothetical protein
MQAKNPFPFVDLFILQGISTAPDDDGPRVKPALKPKGDKLLYESPGTRDKEE